MSNQSCQTEIPEIVYKEVQTDSPNLTDFGTQTMPCIIHQAVEEVIEIISDDEPEDNSLKIDDTSKNVDATVILKITFKTILNGETLYLENHKKFLNFLEQVRSVEPYYKASYFKNYLYLWSTKYFGQWIFEFLATFKYQQNYILNFVYSDSPPDSSDYREICDKLPKKVQTNLALTKVRIIYITISAYKNQFKEDNYKPVLAKIRSLLSANESLKKFFAESNTVLYKNTVKLVTNASMEQAKMFKDIGTSFHSAIFDGLKISIFDNFVKLKVMGVAYESTIEQLETVLNACLQNTSLRVSDWYVAQYKSPSIYVYVPRKDALYIKTYPKFQVKGKYIIIFDFVDQNDKV